MTVCEAGDIVWTDFDPTLGREQAGRRPALVVSPQAFQLVSGMAFVCPITSKIRPFGTSVVLPDGLAVAGEVLTSHMRSVDTQARPMKPAGRVPDGVLAEVRAKLAAIIGVT